MVSSTIYTNHSSLFFDHKNYLKKKDLHWMFLPWLALQGLAILITMILAHSGQVLQLWPVPLTTQWPQQCPVSSRCQCIGYASGGEAGWLWFGALTTNLQFPSTFFAILLRWTIESGWWLPSFFCDWIFQTSWYVPPNHIWLWYISLLWNFWLPLHDHSVLHDYCSIEAALL